MILQFALADTREATRRASEVFVAASGKVLERSQSRERR
jgi:hypothetical protein